MFQVCLKSILALQSLTVFLRMSKKKKTQKMKKILIMKSALNIEFDTFRLDVSLLQADRSILITAIVSKIYGTC